MKKNPSYLVVTLGFAAVINIIGGQTALFLKLPVYLDAMGTLFAALLLGPFYGMIPGIISGIITGVTLDIYSLYFIPVQLLTGFTAGLLSQKGMVKYKLLPVTAFLVTLPGTLAAALISSFLFGGFTSSGSSFFVFLLRAMGMQEIASVFIVQFVTDYLDRLLSAGAVMLLLAALPGNMKDGPGREKTDCGQI